MADALTVIPAAVLRNLADKLYEKRKNAALEVFSLQFSFFSLFVANLALTAPNDVLWSM